MSDQHYHEWVENPGGRGIRAWACWECDETCATCGTCGEASGTALLLCERCRREAARVLDDIAHALSLWDPDPRSLVRSSGNMALVPIQGTSHGGLRTPDDVEAELLGWIARWTKFTAPENSGWLGFLQGHLIWASHHPDESQWLEFLRACRRLRTAARRIAGLLPRFMPEPCAHCGGPVAQDRADREWNPLTGQLPDTVRCLRCGRAWDDPLLFAFTNRQHIVEAPDEHPDALVTIEQARMIWPGIPAATWRSWIFRAARTYEWGVEKAHEWWAKRPIVGPMTKPPEVVRRLIPHGDDPVRYRIGDLAEYANDRIDPDREGRPASERMSA